MLAALWVIPTHHDLRQSCQGISFEVLWVPEFVKQTRGIHAGSYSCWSEAAGRTKTEPALSEAGNSRPHLQQAQGTLVLWSPLGLGQLQSLSKKASGNSSFASSICRGCRWDWVGKWLASLGHSHCSSMFPEGTPKKLQPEAAMIICTAHSKDPLNFSYLNCLTEPPKSLSAGLCPSPSNSSHPRMARAEVNLPGQGWMHSERGGHSFPTLTFCCRPLIRPQIRSSWKRPRAWRSSKSGAVILKRHKWIWDVPR